MLFFLLLLYFANGYSIKEVLLKNQTRRDDITERKTFMEEIRGVKIKISSKEKLSIKVYKYNNNNRVMIDEGIYKNYNKDFYYDDFYKNIYVITGCLDEKCAIKVNMEELDKQIGIWLLLLLVMLFACVLPLLFYLFLVIADKCKKPEEDNYILLKTEVDLEINNNNNNNNNSRKKN